MSSEPEALLQGGQQTPTLPAATTGDAPLAPVCEEEIEVKESVVVDAAFVGDKLVAEKIEEVIECRVIDIEGTKHRWNRETIRAVEIANLGGWAVGEGVLHIDADNNERTLRVDEEVRIEVGVAFAKKVRFKRG